MEPRDRVIQRFVRWGIGGLLQGWSVSKAGFGKLKTLLPQRPTKVCRESILLRRIGKEAGGGPSHSCLRRQLPYFWISRLIAGQGLSLVRHGSSGCYAYIARNTRGSVDENLLGSCFFVHTRRSCRRLAGDHDDPLSRWFGPLGYRQNDTSMDLRD